MNVDDVLSIVADIIHMDRKPGRDWMAISEELFARGYDEAGLLIRYCALEQLSRERTSILIETKGG